MSEAQGKPARAVEVTLHFTSGRTLVTELESDSPPLKALFEALARRRGPNLPSPVLQVPVDGGRRAFTFRSEHLVAIETDPPVVVRPPSQVSASPPGQTPPADSTRPPRRKPPVVREVTGGDGSSAVEDNSSSS